MPGMTLYSVVTDVKNVTDKMLKIFGWSRSKLDDMFSGTNPNSLTQKAAGSVNVFPVVITADIPEQAASIISQMLELEYANFMTLALANSPKINIHKINDGKYLKDYHTNLNKLESVLSDTFDEDDLFESGVGRSITESVFGFNVAVPRNIQYQLMKSMKEAMNPKKEFYGLDWLMEAGKDEEKEYRDARKDQEEAEFNDLDPKDPEYSSKKARIHTSHIKDRNDSLEREHSRQREEASDKAAKIADTIKNVGGVASTVGTAASIAKSASSEIRAWKQYGDQKKETERQHQREEEQTVDSHVGKDFTKTYTIKKINEMQPTPVVAHLFSVDDNGTPSRQIDVVCGVKAHLHQVNKKEFISLMKSEDPGNILTTIVRFTTGEIRFFRDIVFGTNSIKEYAAKSGRFSSSGAKVLATLKRVADLNRTGKNLKPNATLVVSKASVDELKRIHGINLLDEEDALQICERLSLIKLIVSDPIGGKLHILMPKFHDTFSVVSTDTLEKQVDATQDAALTKELRKIVSKGA